MAGLGPTVSVKVCEAFVGLPVTVFVTFVVETVYVTAFAWVLGDPLNRPVVVLNVVPLGAAGLIVNT